MKVHLIKEQTIRKYIAKHSGSKTSFDEWLLKIKFADWEMPGDIKNTFSSADLLGSGSFRVVLDIAGNNF
ncbi:MAG: type II toxin-antitoxin system HigB family toxin [Ginsengibacter sp.]